MTTNPEPDPSDPESLNQVEDKDTSTDGDEEFDDEESQDG